MRSRAAAVSLLVLAHVLLVQGQEERCDLPGAVPPELRENIEVEGRSIPIGIVIPDWASAYIGSYLIKYLLSCVLGYNTSITAINPSSVGTWRLLSGCESSFTGACGLHPQHHVGFELWSSSSNDFDRLTLTLKDEAAVFVGSTGYSGTDGWFVFQQELEQIYDATGFSLDFYRSLNASWMNATPSFDKYTDIDTTLLSPCRKKENYINSIGYYRTYFEWDTAGWYVNNSTQQVGGVCEDGYWWKSPACRARPSLCIPLITGGPGWGAHLFLSQSAAYNIPIAFATSGSWSDYTKIPKLYRTLLYWWTPDSTFVEEFPKLVAFPTHDKSAWYRFDYRTAAVAIDTWKFVSPVLLSSAGRAVDMIKSMSLSEADISGMLLDQKLSDLSYEETAYRWLQAADQQKVWSTWIPDLTNCQEGWGLKTKSGEDTNNRSLAQGCDWCGLGQFSQEFTDSKGGTNICLSCPQGQYQGQPGKTSCGVCLKGTYQDAVGTSACVNCPAGTATDAQESWNCTKCPAGMFAPGSGMTECLHCGVGHYSNSSGFTECQRCPVGAFADAEGNTGCKICGAGKQSAALWATMEKLDTAGSSEAASPWSYSTGSSSNSSCGCKVGAEYTSPLREECILCGAEIGMTCVGMGDVVILPGFAWDGKLSVYRCGGDTKRCPGGAPGVCAAGRDADSVACFRCLPGHSSSGKNDGTCTRCGVGETAPAVVTIVLLFIVMVVMYIVMQRVRSQQRDSTIMVVALCSQLATLIQQLGIIGSITIEWSEPMPSLYKVLQLFNFNLDVLRISCLRNLSRATSTEFLLRCFIVVICSCVIIFTHFLWAALRRHNCFDNLHHLLNTLGSLMLLFFLAIINTIVSPFQCVKHPNGASTVHAYTDVLCWDPNDQEHGRMVIIASVFIIIPLGFLAVCIVAVAFYPGKMRRGEVVFLQTFRFLFLRFKPAAYWYSTYLILRNMLVALTPVLSQPAGQIFCFQMLIITSLLISTKVLPWKLFLANSVDIVFQVGVLLVLCIGSFFLDETKTDTKGFALGVCIFVVALFAMIPLGLGFVIYGYYKRRHNPYTYCFFLSHHKAHAGCMARMMKHMLAESFGKRAFLDADDLKDLTLLFGYVAHNTKTLVMLCTKELFLRPWCLGEIATAKEHNLDSACVFLNGFSPLTKRFIETMDTVVDLSVLSPFSISVENVRDAVTWAMDRRILTMPSVWMEVHASELCKMLVAGDRGDVHVDTRPPPKHAQCTIVADVHNAEALSAAILLRFIMLPEFSQRPELQPFLYDKGLDTRESEIFIFTCTFMCFQQEIVLSAVSAASKRSAFTLAAVCDESFRYPSEAFWAEHEAVWERLNLDVADLHTTVAGVFVDIAVAFFAGSETETVLSMRAHEISERVWKKMKDRDKHGFMNSLMGRSNASSHSKLVIDAVGVNGSGHSPSRLTPATTTSEIETQGCEV